MPHLDEGMLHTYLDDALPKDVEFHLRDCAECRANLEKARLLKRRADTILADVAPVGIAMPSFEELQARAKARGGKVEERDIVLAGRRHRSFSQLRSLAWAATVVLAVAVGWYARSTILESDSGQYVSEGETLGRLTIPLPETEGAASNPTDESTKTNSPGLEQEELTPATDTDEFVGGVAMAADREEARETRRANSPEPSETPARLEEAAGVGAAPVPATRFDSTGGRAAGAGSEATQERQAVRSRPRVLPQVVAERTAAEPMASLATNWRGEGAEVIWSRVDEPTAMEILDGPVPTVAGLPVIEYATSILNGDQSIRVLQRLDSGQLLELVITPEGEAAYAPDAKKGIGLRDTAPGGVDASVNSVTVERGSLRISLSAPLATDSLIVLGQNIPSGR